jgi:hypothetical protein
VSWGSGTLIGPNSILTATHVFEDKSGFGHPVTQIRVLTANGVAFDTQNITSYINPAVSVIGGTGPQARIDGYDPHLANGTVTDVTKDLAVLGIASPINTLPEGRLLPYRPYLGRFSCP